MTSFKAVRVAASLAFSLFVGLIATTAAGSVLTVTSLKDKNSPGTLRSAIKSAVCGDVIEFAPALFVTGPKTMLLSNGFAINTAVSIVGPGAGLLTIDGGGQYQIFSVTTNCQTVDCGGSVPASGVASVTLSGMTIKGGLSSGGGGVLVSKNSCVNLVGCRLVGNETKSNGGGSSFGGGVYNRGVLVMDQCVVESNLAGLASVPGNPGGAGGGVYNEGDAVVTRSLFVGNQGAFGGGLASGGGSLIVESSTFSGNQDQSAAGGLFINGGVAELTNLTVIGNTSILGSGRIRAANGGFVEIRSSIVANNSGPGTGSVSGGSIVSLGYNLFSAKPLWAGTNDQVNTDPKLGPLADNGGTTRTHAPLSGSPALNAGHPSFSSFLQATDQRGAGFGRVLSGRVDVGAYEENYTLPSIVCPPDRSAECVNGGATLTVSVQVNDGDGDTLTVTWRIGGVVVQTNTGVAGGSQVGLTRFFSKGTTTITVEVSDGRNTDVCSTTVTVVDRVPPVITVIGPDPFLVECGSAFVDPGATALDVCEGSVTVNVSGIVDTSVLGETTLVYAASDGSNPPALKTRKVRVVDTTPPVISASGPLSRDAVADCSYTLGVAELQASASDICDPNPVLSYWLEAGEIDDEITTGSRDLAVGVHTIRIEAVDASGNAAVPVTVQVTVNDVTKPVIILDGLDPIVINCGDPFVDPGATATDGCDGDFPAASSGLDDTASAGSFLVTYTAVDKAGNAAISVTRTVEVLPSVAIEVPTDLPTFETDPGFCSTQLDLSKLVSVTGSCLSDATFEVTIVTDGEVQTLDGLTRFDFPKGTSDVVVRAYYLPYGPDPIATSDSFTVTVIDTLLNCADNKYWPVSLDFEFSQLFENNGRQITALLQQYLSGQGERRWVRIRNVPAGARLTVALSNPAGVNYDLTAYRDIQEAYDELLALLNGSGEDQVSALLGTQFSPEAFAPDAFAPDAFAPDAFAPDAFAPDAFAPDAFAPDAFAPDAFAPDAFAPDAFAPDAFAPDAFAPDAFAPDAFAPDAFAAAQNRVLASFSAFDGPTDGVRVTNFEETTDYYIRISGRNGAFSTASPFTLVVELESEICDGVSTEGALDPAFTGTVVAASAPKSLILWDSLRMAHYAASETELGSLNTALGQLATAAGGVLVDVSAHANVNALNGQADDPVYVNCPYAKNLVAEAIRNIVLAHRSVYPTIEDVTIVGNDDVIPFFRRSDDANLANEAQYFPPVLNNTQSQSALRTGRVLEQDAYGSSCRVVLSTGEYQLPGLPVGRLVEEAADVIRTVAQYLPVLTGSNPGLMPTPTSAISIAYDFMGDAGEAILNEFAAGLGSGGSVSELISASNLSPSESWTASDFNAAFLGQRHDLVFIGAHFSTASALAADYITRFTAAQLDASSVDLRYAIVTSQGCHSGYSTVDPHAIRSVTLQPDWAQAFARKGAILLAGTGYQYGETQLLEYGERLYLEFARQLRTGTGPVSIGQAMVRAKLAYLAQTPNMRGIHEKTLLVGLTLYGLPMVKVDLPGDRLPGMGGTGAGLATSPLGGDFSLETASLSLTPALARETLTLEVVGQNRTVDASYYVGSDGAVSLVAEPIRPLESESVNAQSGALLRGVVVRSASYVDETPFLPLTGAPATEIRGVSAPFKSDVYYPIIPWATNQIGALCGDGSGGNVLNVFPAQFRSDPINPAAEAGALRRYTAMGFDLFYSDNLTQKALTPAPAVNGVAAELSVDGTEIVIEAVIETSAAIGVHEVLATFTGEPGSPWYGAWNSVNLTPTSTPRFFPDSLNADGFIRTWTASIPLSGNASDLRFIIQTVGANGPALQATNFGRYFRVGGDPATGDTPSSVTILTSTASGAYGTTVLVEAEIRSEGVPVPDGERVDFRLGPVARSALTVSGVARAELTLYAAPRGYNLEASYRGSSVYAPSSAQQPFAVVKQDSVLSFEGVPEFSQPGDWYAYLRTVDGKPLKEKTVVFVITNVDTSESFIVSEITDGAGRAAPGALSLPTGEYAVGAYFATPEVPGTDVNLVDPLYNDSTAVGVFTVSLEVAFSARSARVTYNDTTVSGLSGDDRGLSVARLSGGLELTDPTVDPSDILGGSTATGVMAKLLVRLSGQTLVDAEIPLSVASGGSDTWKGSWASGGTKADLELIWSGSAYFDSALTNPDGPRIRSLFIGSSSTDMELTVAKGNYTVTFTNGIKTVSIAVQGGRVNAVSGDITPDNYIISSSKQLVEFTLPYPITGGQVIKVQGRYGDIAVTKGANLFPVEGRFGVVITQAPGSGPAYSDVPAILEATIAVGTANGETPAAGSVKVGDEETPWTEEAGPVYRRLNPGDS